VRNVSRSVLLMLLVALAMTSPVAADATVYFVGYAMSVPAPLLLLVFGLALLGVGGLVRKWRSGPTTPGRASESSSTVAPLR